MPAVARAFIEPAPQSTASADNNQGPTTVPAGAEVWQWGPLPAGEARGRRLFPSTFGATPICSRLLSPAQLGGCPLAVRYQIKFFASCGPQHVASTLWPCYVGCYACCPIPYLLKWPRFPSTSSQPTSSSTLQPVLFYKSGFKAWTNHSFVIQIIFSFTSRLRSGVCKRLKDVSRCTHCHCLLGISTVPAYL